MVTLKGIKIYDISMSLQDPILIFNALETYLKDGEVYQDETSKGILIFFIMIN